MTVTSPFVFSREIELRAESPVTINRGPGFTSQFFIIYSGGNLTIGADPITEEAVGAAITLDGQKGSVTGVTGSLIEISSSATCLLGAGVTLRNNNKNNNGGGVLAGGNLTLWGKITDNESTGANGGGVYLGPAGHIFTLTDTSLSSQTAVEISFVNTNTTGNVYLSVGGSPGSLTVTYSGSAFSSYTPGSVCW
jgi:hypothetical protein